MKKPRYLFLFVCLFLLFPASAAADATAAGGPVFPETPGHGGPFFRMTWIDGEFVLFGGGPLMFQAADGFSLGIFVSYPDGDIRDLDIYYGGVKAEYTVRLASSLGLTFGLGAGPGGVFGPGKDPTFFFCVEPEACLDLQPFPFVAFSAGAGYRAAFAQPDGLLSTAQLSGAYFVASLKYGQFEDAEPLFLNVEPERRREFGMAGMYQFQVRFLGGQALLLDGGGTQFLFSAEWRYRFDRSVGSLLRHSGTHGPSLKICYRLLFSTLLMLLC